MKLTRQRLRRLIIESINETKRYISSPDGSVTPANIAFQRAEEKDMYAGDLDPMIADLMDTDNVESRRQGRELAHMIATQDSQLAQFGRLTPEEEVAIDHMGWDKSSEESFPREGVEQLVDKGALYGAMKSKSDGILSHFGFDYIVDAMGPAGDYDGFGPMLRFQASALGCNVEELAYVDQDKMSNKKRFKTYQAIVEMIREKKPQGMSIPGDDGNFGYNQIYDLDGLKILYTDHHSHETLTICG
jgi:hypothetical protein